ncbi:MAG: M23 family metallopeptidase [Lachnospiraceae bacterium]
MEKKDRDHYKVLIVLDQEKNSTKQFSVSLEVFIVFFVAIALVMIAALAYCYLLIEERNASNRRMKSFQVQNEELVEQNTSLIKENKELQEKVTILSDTVNNKVYQEEKREAQMIQSYIPTGFPIKGAASYNEEEKELEGNPAVIFQASAGTSVIATANGTVSSIAGSAEAGYIVMIDHGNGYYTVYRNNAEPRVKEGDSVTGETTLFHIETGNETLGYQIIQEEKFIDPLDLMDISG